MTQQTSRTPSRSVFGVLILGALFFAVGVLILGGLGAVTVYVLVPNTAVAREQAARQQMLKIRDAAHQYHLNHGEYPETVEELLLPDPDNGDQPYLTGDAAVSPWGRPFRLQPPEEGESRVLVYTDTPAGQRLSNLDR